jgi:hypothetical protein
MRAVVNLHRRKGIVVLIVTSTSVVMGISLAFQPFLAWFVLAGVLILALLSTPPYILACSAVLAVVFSRLLVAWDIAPGFINFLHFPLALFAALFAALSSRHEAGYKEKHLVLGILFLGILIVMSWIINGGEFFRPILTWLLFSEPFLILYTIVKTTPRGKVHLIARLALGLALVQIPFAFWQAVTLGLGDVVQGTLVGQGAGAHVIGAITLMALIVLTTEIFYGRRRSWPLHWLFIALLFVVPVLSDAKQTIIAFIPAMFFLLWSYGKFRLRSFLISTTIAFFASVSVYFYSPLRKVLDFDLVLMGLGGKVLAYKIIVQKMLEFPPTFLIGLGPGHSVSRAALAAQEGYIRSLPSGWVDLTLSPVTTDIFSTTTGFHLFVSSSVWSGVSSWLGLFGDLGLFGVTIYTWLLWVVWNGLKGHSSSWTLAGRGVLLMGVLLGTVFSWLEIPEFTLPWVLYMALGLIMKSNENPPNTQPLHPTRR